MIAASLLDSSVLLFLGRLFEKEHKSQQDHLRPTFFGKIFCHRRTIRHANRKLPIIVLHQNGPLKPSQALIAQYGKSVVYSVIYYAKVVGSNPTRRMRRILRGMLAVATFYMMHQLAAVRNLCCSIQSISSIKPWVLFYCELCFLIPMRKSLNSGLLTL